ncbi:MAG: hypothetical protein J2P25_00405 [Nocardiopsaceae bacterium]|nr:hypothetical protein [Nocardiopsaceae bacterium]
MRISAPTPRPSARPSSRPRSSAVKVRLLDQHALAGVGKLVADDTLWRAGVYPGRPVDVLTGPERQRLYRALRDTIDQALRDGGVHVLPLVPHRRPGGHCPRDGAELRRSKVGGRTTFWCPAHQS